MDKITAAKIMEENMKTIFAYALSRVTDKADAEDLAGDIIVNFLANADKLRDDRAVFGYIWTIAANTTKKFLSKRSKSESRRIDARTEEDGTDFSDPDSYADPDSDFTTAIEHREESMTLRRELALLSKEYRECTVAYYFDELSCREISEKFGISVEMVKYYLYKTRRILKEGMTMTREFGERSYRPATFRFNTIFDERGNREYQNLFNRKLPGNILYSAYYTPMTVGELSVELGVSAVYLEDEIELLKKYNLVSEMASGKYQTKLCVFTEAYDMEFYHTAEERFKDRLGGILEKVKGKLPEIRTVGFRGCAIDENRLMWALYYNFIRLGYHKYADNCDEEYKRTLYDSAKGVNYGVDYDDFGGEYSASAFAGYYGGIGDGIAANFADFGVLGEKNAWGQGHNWERMNELIKASIKGGDDAPLVVFGYKGERDELLTVYDGILADETAELESFYRDLTECAIEVMKNHAPKAIHDEVDAVLKSTIFHRTVGLMGKIAVDSGELRVPEDDLPCAVFLFETKRHESGLWGDCHG